MPEERRVEIIGATHPHKGAVGSITETEYHDGKIYHRVTFDAPRRGISCTFAKPENLKPLPEKKP